MLIGVPLTDLAVDATDLDEKSPGQSIGYRAKIEMMLEAELNHHVVNSALHMIVHYGGLGQSLLLTAAAKMVAKYTKCQRHFLRDINHHIDLSLQ